MESIFSKILCPVDLDGSAPSALRLAGDVARACGGEVHVLHVIPMVLSPAAMPTYVNLYRGEEQELAKGRLADLASKNLGSVPGESKTVLGEPAAEILAAAKRLPADLVVMATHGRQGFSRFFLGSIAETVMRGLSCPVLTVKSYPSDQYLVARWMTPRPVTVPPDQKLTMACMLMQERRFRSLPVVQDGSLLGIITDRDIRTNLNYLESIEVGKVMTEKLITVSPNSSIWEAAQLMRDRKIGALPVLEDGQLVGIISTTDLLKAFTELQ
jgi:nucleotide-binding universal stress UspA family protein/predicted transcriptional regulator